MSEFRSAGNYIYPHPSAPFDANERGNEKGLVGLPQFTGRASVLSVDTRWIVWKSTHTVGPDLYRATLKFLEHNAEDS